MTWRPEPELGSQAAPPPPPTRCHAQAEVPSKYVVTTSWSIVKNFSDHLAAMVCGDEEETGDPSGGLLIRPWFKRPRGDNNQIAKFELTGDLVFKNMAQAQAARMDEASKTLQTLKDEGVAEEVLNAAPKRRRTQKAAAVVPIVAPIADAIEGVSVS